MVFCLYVAILFIIRQTDERRKICDGKEWVGVPGIAAVSYWVPPSGQYDTGRYVKPFYYLYSGDIYYVGGDAGPMKPGDEFTLFIYKPSEQERFSVFRYPPKR